MVPWSNTHESFRTQVDQHGLVTLFPDMGEPKLEQENKTIFSTMTDYLLHPSFLKKPIPTQIAIIKCCERFTKGRPESVHVIKKGIYPDNDI